MEPDGFWDRHHRFSYLVACENARRLLAEPGLIAEGLAHLQRFAARDPRQAEGYRIWSDLLTRPPADIAALLVERSERGDEIRATAPAFGALSGAVRARLVAQARCPIAGAAPP